MIRAITAAGWFPAAFAVLQTLRHAALLAYDYWTVATTAKNFDSWEFLWRDLQNPFFEPTGFCFTWVSYTGGQSAALGIDLPVYIAATALFALMSGQSGCVDQLTSPRGNVITTALCFPIWYLIGRSLRRVASGRWRSPAQSKALRALLTILGFPALGLGAALFALAIPLLLLEGGQAIRPAGTGLWLIWCGLLAAERLRVWPFPACRRLLRRTNERA